MTVDFVYALHDVNKSEPLAPIPLARAKEFNEKGFGIFWTVNSFKSLTRAESNLKSLDALYADLDSKNGIDKTQMLSNIKSGLLKPSTIVETKNGYHVYWIFKNPVTNPNENQINFYKEMMRQIIIPSLNADPNASDASRLLRVPGYLHLKDPSSPFLVETILSDGPRYSFEVIRSIFEKRLKRSKVDQSSVNKNYSRTTSSIFTANGQSYNLDDEFWIKANNLDAISSLLKISGTEAVKGEIIEIGKVDHKGRRRIYCNMDETNAWIDSNGKIGSTDNGGPTIVNWINWYQQDMKRTAELIKKYLM